MSEAAPPLSQVQCPRCRAFVRVEEDSNSTEVSCSVCNATVEISCYPRLFHSPARDAKLSLSGDDEAKCSFYPELKAEKICEECGCFMSEKASIQWIGKDFCLPCLHRLREEEKATDFVASAKLYDKRALMLVTWMAPFTLFTAPVALFLLLRFKNAPNGFTTRSKATWWVALLLSIVWLLGWTAVIVVWVSLILEGFS